jgi:Flp pilus assembly protein TadG
MNPRRAERGLASVELVIVAPAFLLFVALLLFAGRVALAEQAVQAAAAEAARAASTARTAEQARAQATTWAQTSLDNQQLGCRTQQVHVDTTGFAAPVGTPAQVAATVTCVLDLADLSAPVPGSYTTTATMTSPLDTYRSRQ